MANPIRLLKANEIECRIGTMSAKGVSLLLYKDARCDMAILDETFGSLNWQRSHSRDNANCTVSIWDETKQQWVSKEDTGTESRTEAEKGLCSDSFKRACVNIGIGRELYTAPLIWVPAEKCRFANGKCCDRFSVRAIGYNDAREIDFLEVENEKTRVLVYSFGKPHGKPNNKTCDNVPAIAAVAPQEQTALTVPTNETIKDLQLILACVVDEESAGLAIQRINAMHVIPEAEKQFKKELIKKAATVGLTFDGRKKTFVRKDG